MRLPISPNEDFIIGSIYGSSATRKSHFGVDFTPKDGISKDNIPIYSVSSGTVIQAEYCNYFDGAHQIYGNYVIVRTYDGSDILYAHLKNVLVKKDQTIPQNTIIGIMGYTGNTDPDDVERGTHLHFEVRKTPENKDLVNFIDLDLYNYEKQKEEGIVNWYANKDKNPCDYLGIENIAGQIQFIAGPETIKSNNLDDMINEVVIESKYSPGFEENINTKSKSIGEKISDFFNAQKTKVNNVFFPPTVLVRKGSIDEAILRDQYGGLINFAYAGINQFIGRDREQTNSMYQEYIKKHFGISPVNPDIDLSQYRSNEKDSPIPSLNWLEIKTRFASSVPTVIVREGSKDKAILKDQYGEGAIQFEDAAWNQFIGSDREETNRHYQQYLAEIYNLQPKNKVDLSSYHDGGIVGGEATNNLVELANQLFNIKPNEAVVKSLIGELQVPPQNIMDNFIPNMKLFHTLAQAPNNTVQSVYMDISINRLNEDKEGAEKFFKIIGNEMKRKGVR